MNGHLKEQVCLLIDFENMVWDFIHVLKSLRRHGKTVIGVAPDNAVSEDFAALCDRFVAYSALRNVQAEQTPEIGDAGSLPPLREVGRTLGKLLHRSPEGLKGAQIIPALRREISPTFHVSSYGFAKLGEMLAALPTVCSGSRGPLLSCRTNRPSL